MHQLEFEITPEEESVDYGKFVVSPLTQGYGSTLGNSLRRVLLSSLEGAAATIVRIKDVEHRFSTLPGLKEDVLELLLRIKEVKFRLDGIEEATVKLKSNGPGDVSAGDFETPAGVEVVNKDLILGTLADKKAKLQMEVDIKKGYGYSPFEERNLEKIGVLPIDAVFSPVTRVNYKVEETRVGKMTNLDRLVFEVWTDGTVEPRKAVNRAAKIMIDYLNRLLPAEEKVSKKAGEEEGETPIEILKLSTRIENILKLNDVETVEGVTKMDKTELKQLKNMGPKSVQEIKEKLEENDLSLKEN